VIELVPGDERGQVLPHALDDLAGRFSPTANRFVSEPRDGRPYVMQRAGSNVFVDFVEFRLAGDDQIAVDGVALGVHLHRGVEERHVANVVAPHDEVLPRGQADVGEQRQFAHQAGRAHQALVQCGQSDTNRRGDAPLDADQPYSDARTCHTNPKKASGAIGRGGERDYEVGAGADER
jgi:hypothetical protein